MTKSILVVLLAVLTFISVACAAGKPEESFKKDFPEVKVESVKESPIKGVYEVVTSANILYYYPAKGYIIVGPIINKDKKNLTADRMGELASAKYKELALDKAIKIGNGKNIVVEFTDPDCPFCRKMSDYLKTRTDLTRYVFLYPLPMHQNAPAKIKYILCSDDKVKTLEEVMKGKLDNAEFKVCDDKKIADLVDEHRKITVKTGINGTPAFFVNGKFVSGADIPKFESYLK